MVSASFPVLVLQPTLGSNQEWVGVRLRSAESIDPTATLKQLCSEFGLAEALAGLSCLLPADVMARLDLDALPSGLVLQPDDDSLPPVQPTHPFCSGPTQTLLLKILAQIARDAETRDIEATLKQDPQLSVQLLRLVNSVAFSPDTQIHSFAHAITLLGRRQLQRWLQLLLFASHASETQSNPLLARAALRATLMEGLCKAAGGGPAAQDEAFMVGMFSLLEALLSQPLAAIIGPLKLAVDVSNALLQHAGVLGDMLTLVETAEQEPDAVAAALERIGINSETWCKAQIDALSWAIQVSRGN